MLYILVVCCMIPICSSIPSIKHTYKNNIYLKSPALNNDCILIVAFCTQSPHCNIPFYISPICIFFPPLKTVIYFVHCCLIYCRELLWLIVRMIPLSPSLSPSPGDGSSADWLIVAFRLPHNINGTRARMVRRVRRQLRMVDCCILHKLNRGRLSVVHDVRRRTFDDGRCTFDDGQYINIIIVLLLLVVVVGV